MPKNSTEYFKMWINADENLYRYWTARAAVLDAEELRKELKEYFTNDNFPFKSASVYSDLLTMAINQTEWHEIAKELKETDK